MFWLRLIESNRPLVELGKFDLLAEFIRKEYPQYSGTVLEKYFRQLYGEQERVTDVAAWWDNQGENEIDLIALQRLDHRVIVAEVKRSARKYVSALLEEKYQHIKNHLRGYQVELRGLSMDDM